jgi:Fe-S cluster assembly iron-binding protein IscA
MLSITGQAASAIRRVNNTKTYPYAGLRIRSVDDHHFAMTVVPAPSEEDVAVRAPGANVYLDHDAAAALSHATLDAAENATRANDFALARFDV